MYAQPKVDDPNIVIPPIRNTAIPTGKTRRPMDQNIRTTIFGPNFEYICSINFLPQ